MNAVKLRQSKLDNNEKRFEEYLHDFVPRKPRALPELIVHRKIWPRRLAAVAVIAISLGAAGWFVRRRSESKSGELVAPISTGTPEAKSPERPLRLLPLTQLALENPAQLDEQLTTASSSVLPDFRGTNSALRALAKE
jgi:hypothetical protein